MKNSLFIFALLLFTKVAVSQNTKVLLHNYIFSADSLVGFEEDAAKNSAISEGFLGEEFKVRIWKLKREYINSKYNIAPKPVKYKNSTYNNNFRTSLASVCINEDFEGSTAGVITNVNQINGWTLSSGLNQMNTCNITTTNTTSESELINCTTGGFIDPTVGGTYPIYSVFGTVPNSGNTQNPSIPNMYGTNIIRINNNINDYSIEKLSKTILVTTSNNLFQFAFIGVFSTGHTCCDAGAFMINLTNATTNMPLSCPSFSCSGNSLSCPSSTDAPAFYNAGSGTPATSSSAIVFNKWRIGSLDLSAYIGQSITIDITATDCDAGGHYGYTYFDSQCSSTNMTINNSAVSASASSINFPTCGATTFTITAPDGQGPYMWSGLSVGPPFNAPLMSNQVFTTNLVGTYTLTMYPIGNCGPVTKTVNIAFTPAASPLSITGNTYICSPLSTTLSVTGANSYTWSTGSNANNIVLTPTATTNYTVTGTDLNNCINSASVNVTVGVSVNLSVSGSNIVCIGSSTTFTLNGAGSYSLNAVPCANTINILPAITTNYTITGAYSANCFDTQTLTVYVNTSCADVWPGDANSDGIADNLDVLELGLHFAQTGSVRSTSSNLWQSYFANNWAGLISNGQNLNHSDCNGDGTIDLNDTLAIFNNYNFTHAFKNANSNISNPQVIIIPDQSFVPSGQWGSASIYLGDSTNAINNINGLAFSVDVVENYLLVSNNAIAVDYPVSFINPLHQNLNFRKTNTTNTTIYTATTHTNNLNANGFGKVGVFYFHVDPAITSQYQLNFGLSNANKSDVNGIITPLSVGSLTSVLVGVPNGIKENITSNNNISIYPNPTSGIITLKSTKEIQKVEVTNIAGQTLMSESGKGKTQQVNLNGFAEGIYFVKIYSDDNSVTWKKITIKQ